MKALTNLLQIEKRKRIINQAIQECVAVLGRKLRLMKCRDSKTLEDFKEWFGSDNKGFWDIILNRIERALNICEVITVNDFSVVVDEKARKDSFAIVHPDDEFHTICLGDLFWNVEKSSNESRGRLFGA